MAWSDYQQDTDPRLQNLDWAYGSRSGRGYRDHGLGSGPICQTPPSQEDGSGYHSVLQFDPLETDSFGHGHDDPRVPRDLNNVFKDSGSDPSPGSDAPEDEDARLLAEAMAQHYELTPDVDEGDDMTQTAQSPDYNETGYYEGAQVDLGRSGVWIPPWYNAN